MSEWGSYLVEAILAPLVESVLLAAGVNDALIAGARLAGWNADTLATESRLRSTLHCEYERLVSSNLAEATLSAGIPGRGALAEKSRQGHAQNAAPPAATEVSDALARAAATRAALNAEIPLRLIADTWCAAELQDADRALRQARLSYANGAWADALAQARLAERGYSIVAFDAHERLLRAQDSVLTDQTARVLGAMGYHVERVNDNRGAALWATRDGRAIATLIGRGGRVLMDMAGFDGVACHLEAERLLGALAQNGIRLRREQVVLHGRRRGGPLVASVSRAKAPGSRPTRQARRAAMSDTRYRRAVAWLWQQQQKRGGQA